MLNQVGMNVNESVMKTVSHRFNNQGFSNSNELVYDEKLRSALSTPVFVNEAETSMSETS